MPLYLISTRKAINTNGITAKWSNRYFVQADTTQGALDAANGIWELGERPFHNALAFCYEVYANNTEDPPNTPGTTQPVAAGVMRGGRPATAASTTVLMPLANVVRVDFPVQESRPSRKFYRIPLLETDITSAQLDADIFNAVATGCEFIAGLALMRDVDGQAYMGSAVVRGLTVRRLGRDADRAVPPGPPFG